MFLPGSVIFPDQLMVKATCLIIAGETNERAGFRGGNYNGKSGGMPS